MKRKRKFSLKLNSDNRGLSLVELIVAVMIMGLVSGIIVVFISTSRTSYQIVDQSTVLQSETEVATSFIREIAVQSSKYGSGAFTTSDGGVSYTNKVIWFYGPDNINPASGKNYYYFVIYDAKNSALRYKRVLDDVYVKADGVTLAVPDTSGIVWTDEATHNLNLARMLNDASVSRPVIGDAYALLAEHAKDISVAGEVGKQGLLLTVKLNFKYSDAEYPTTLKIVARNGK